MTPVFSGNKKYMQPTVILFKVFGISLVLFMLVLSVFTVRDSSEYGAVYAADEYRLPYPGILPTHPLYPLKQIRDSFMVFFARDPIKKAEAYLLLADKKIFMADLLVQNLEWERGVAIAHEAEKHLGKVQEFVEKGYAMGNAPDVTFDANVQKSAAKHKEILQRLQKSAPSTIKKSFQEALLLNASFSSWVEKRSSP